MPLYRQLYSELRGAIVNGRLAAGSLLPSSRTLAREIDVSRNTVMNAYDQLIAEGYMETQIGSATTVSTVVSNSRSKRIAPTGIPGHATLPKLSKRGFNVQQSLGGWIPLPEAVAFAPGVPAYDQFPAKRWALMLAEQAQRMQPAMADSEAHLGGYGPLRETLTSYLRSSRMVTCDPDQVLIVSSARAGLDLICRLVANPGERCLVEEPGYITAKNIMLSAGLELFPVPVDTEGMSISSVDQRNMKARLAFVTPSHQWPMGFSLSAIRRQQLLDWANKENSWIVEDDYDSEFRFDSRPLASLQGLDEGRRVIYVGTFSKVLFPSLRIGYLVVPQSLILVFKHALFLTGQEPPLHIQAALARFIQDGYFFSHIRRMRLVYKRRQAKFAVALTRHLGSHIPVARPPGGMQLVLPLPKAYPAEKVSVSAAEIGLHVRPVGMYALTDTAPNALHLGFAAVPDRQIEPATESLADAIRAVE